MEAAADGARAWEILQGDNAPPLAILDWMMPELDGIDVCRLVRERPGNERPYLILLTARGTKEDIVAGLEAGADDYLGKPFDPEELRARLEAGRRFAELYERLLSTQKELERQARTDLLTGILNRGAVVDRLIQELNRAGRENRPCSIAIADIDHFKRVNDTHGHAAGDRVLKTVVERMCRGLRPYDLLGRYGGEEFLLVLPGVGLPEASRVFQRVRSTVSAAPIDLDGGSITITISVGVVIAAGESADALLVMADEALYQAKNRGRDRVVMYERDDG